MRSSLLIFLLAIFLGCGSDTSQKDDLPGSTTLKKNSLTSWNEGAAKTAITEFVSKTTTPGSLEYIPVADRIACFDNDGTLWGEQPFYFQLLFAVDRVKALAAEHPEWKTKQPYQALLNNDLQTALSGGEHAILEIVMATHAGITTEEFDIVVRNWINTATHPITGKRYVEMVYQPMIELIEYLRANEYKIFIVSGGGVDFMRVWAEEVYGIPPYQIIGSSGKVKYEVHEGIPALIKLPEINFIDDKSNKPIGIHQYIGKRPVIAVGNSDGDYEMLHYTTTATGHPRFGMIIHHTDSVREVAYDRESSIGRLDRALNDAGKYNWTIVNMAADWKYIYR